MITQLTGKLVSAEAGLIAVELQGITYEVLTPIANEVHWREQVNGEVTLFVFNYLEAQGQGNVFLPRLIGFTNVTDREFFHLFTKVKGIGYRKALRIMVMPAVQIAEAIAGRDVSFLKTLPEIGKRTAETIIAELHEKMEPFLAKVEVAREFGGGTVGGKSGENIEGKEAGEGTSRHTMAREALAVLLQLGENRLMATQWIDRVLAESGDDGEIDSVEDLVNAAFRFREG